MIVTWDLEIAPSLLEILTYDLKVNISRYDYRDIRRDWNILSAAWMIDGKIKCVAIDPKDPFNDKEIVTKLPKVLSKATLLIGHNADAFDLKKFNTRAIYHGLKPLPPIPSVDTLKVARKSFAFTSKKLAYIAQFLKVGAKDESPDWRKVLAGNRAEIRRMKTYNKKDVEVTWAVYKKLQGFIANHPNMNLLHPVKDVKGAPVENCPNCQSPDTQRAGIRVLRTGRYQRMHCRSCGAYWKGGKTK